MTLWEKVKKNVHVLWTVGRRLRQVYNGSKNEDVRRRDRQQTFLRVTLFVLCGVMFMIVDGYDDALVAVHHLLWYVGKRFK